MQTTFASSSGMYPLSPEGLAFDNAGNLYASSLFENTIYKFTPGGGESIFADTNISSPFGLAFDSAGNLYEADAGSGSILKYAPNGSQSYFFTLTNDSPYGLTFNNAGDLFVAAKGGSGGVVYKITPGGMITTFVSGLNSPYDLAFDSAGNLFVADNGDGNIYEFDPTGFLTNTITTGTGAWGLAFDSSGNLFATDSGSNIYQVDTNGMVTTYASDLFTGTYLTFGPVPEPSSWSLLGGSAIALLLLGRAYYAIRMRLSSTSGETARRGESVRDSSPVAFSPVPANRPRESVRRPLDRKQVFSSASR
jgi:sugar lactone lactonase YvrE